MPPIDLPGQAPPTIAPCLRPSVFVDGLRRDDLIATQWELLPAPQLARCQIVATQPAGAASCPSLDLHSLPPIGSCIQLKMDDGTQLLAVTTGYKLEITPAGPLWVAQAASQLADRLSATIVGRYQQSASSTTFIDNTHVRFASATGMLASATTTTIAGRTCRTFDSAPDAIPWTLADAIAYLLAAHAPADVTVPALGELSASCSAARLDDFDATGMPLIEALTKLAHRAGLDLRSAATGLALEFYKPGIDGRPKSITLQPPGQVFSADSTNLFEGSANFTSPRSPTVLALGDCKHYEVTLELKPGWDHALETTRWRDFARSMSDDWPSLAGVFRRWVLNEHGWYNDAPWNLPTCDLSAISDDFQLAIPRTFQPCVSADAFGQSMGVFVEVRCAPDGQWRPWPGAVWVSGGECAITLGGDTLPADFFQATLAGNASVRVTATLRSDVQIQARAQGDPAAGLKVLDLSHQAHWRTVHSSSVFASASSAHCDDTPQLQQLADLTHAKLRTRTQGQLKLGWIDTSFQAGDLIAGIDGQGLDWSMGSTRPFVRTVKHDFLSQHTILGIGG